MDFAQVRTLIRESHGPNGGGGPPNKTLVVLIVGSYLVIKSIEKALERKN